MNSEKLIGIWRNGHRCLINLSSSQKWFAYKWGYFVIISNELIKPDMMLEKYFGRIDIEAFFKSAKDFLDLLPLSKWHKDTVEGKILNDMICSIIYVKLKEAINAKNKATTKLIPRASH